MHILRILLLWGAVCLQAPAFANDDAISNARSVTSTGGGRTGEESALGHAKAPLDLQYIDTMRRHHQSGVELAALAADRAAHAKLENLAQKMVESQRRDLEQLAEWRKAWYAGHAEAVNMELPGMQGSMRGMDQNKLRAAKGEKFDRLFLRTMIRHHQGAIEMSRHAAKNLEHDALQRFAERKMKTQRREVARMKEWQEAWDPSD